MMVRSDERRISGFPHSIIWEGRSVANIGYIFGSGARSVVRSIVKRVEVAIIKGKYAEKVISIRSVSRYGRKQSVITARVIIRVYSECYGQGLL